MDEGKFSTCMKRMKKGDKNALHEVYNEYVGYIYSIIFNVVSNKEDAEDVTSEFFLKLWKISGTYKGGNGHKAWLAAIARNMAIDLMRKTKREILVDDFCDNVPENAADECVEQEVVADVSLKQALEALKPNEREIVNLKIMGDMTFQEISKVLHIPMGTVTWRYQSAIRKLRRYGYE